MKFYEKCVFRQQGFVSITGTYGRRAHNGFIDKAPLRGKTELTTATGSVLGLSSNYTMSLHLIVDKSDVTALFNAKIRVTCDTL